MVESTKAGRGVLYIHHADGSIGLAVTGDLSAPGRFHTYPLAVRARVRIAFTLGHHADEAQKLSYAFAISPAHYAAVLDDLLCARADAEMSRDARRERVMHRVNIALEKGTLIPAQRRPIERER